MNETPTMAKAFASVRGALKRQDSEELRCKKIWLERVIKELPGTIYANEAKSGLASVNSILEKYEN